MAETAQDLAHKRPWLLLSLLFGIGYMLPFIQQLPGAYLILWKICAVGFLVPYALRRHHNGDFAIAAGFLALCALGDGLIEMSMEAGGAAFGAAHLVAIWLFSRHRRAKLTFSQKYLALTVFLALPVIGYLLAGPMAAIYALLLSAMAAMAWSSSFPRYRVGLGAMIFAAADLILFARAGGHIGDQPLADYAIWYLYYGAILLMAIGIVQTLAKASYSVSPAASESSAETSG